MNDRASFELYVYIGIGGVVIYANAFAFKMSCRAKVREGGNNGIVIYGLIIVWIVIARKMRFIVIYFYERENPRDKYIKRAETAALFIFRTH